MSLLLSEPRNQSDSGYFRIGDVVLDIPPTSISTNKIVDLKELSALRAKFPMYIKEGHSRWDVTISWIALVTNDLGAANYSQWYTLRRILAIFKAAPFVQVENAHIRQMVMNNPELGVSDQSARMAFAMRQLRVDTMPDVPQGLQCTLTMSWFNYLPYSATFGYLNYKNQPADATETTYFKEYIDTWTDENLSGPPDPFNGRVDLSQKFGYPDMPDWEKQTAGTVVLNWRKYTAIPMEQQTAVGGESAASVPDTSSHASGLPAAATTPTTKEIRQKITDAANRHGVDPALALALSYEESEFNPTAKNPSSPAYGLFQLIPRWFPGVDVTDVDQNIEAGVKYLADSMNRYHGNVEHAIWGYGAGYMATDKYLSGQTKVLSTHDDIIRAANRVLKYYGTEHADVQTTPVADASPLKSATSAADSQAAASGSNPSGSLPKEALELVRKGWSLDHSTERASFLWYSYTAKFADEEHGDGPNADSCYPVQISVAFVNNLPVQPLQGFQYPVMQHVGPAGTVISIGFQSNGHQEGAGEPQHPGPARIAGMCAALEDQFHRLRGEWRSIYAIHRMQAVVVQNQMLNMLGIYGTLVRNFTSETLEQSGNLMQAALNLAQYENVFEELGSYQVNGITGAYVKVLQDMMADGSLAAAAAKNQAYQPLQKYKTDRDSRNSEPILKMLQDPDYQAKIIPMPVKLTKDQLSYLMNAVYFNEIDSRVSSAAVPFATPLATKPALDPRLSKIFGAANTSQFSYNDYYQFVHSPAMAGNKDVKQVDVAVNQVIAAQLPASQDPVKQLYDDLLDYQGTSHPAVVRAITEMQMDPALGGKFASAVDPAGPAGDSRNTGHGAYRDLGLKAKALNGISATGADFSPAYYFDNDDQRQRKAMHDQVPVISQATTDALNIFNQSQANARVSTLPGDHTFKPSDSQNPGSLKANFEVLADHILVPCLNMKRAFPTFKLFLVEESADNGPFYMYDNFYTYASVLSMEVIKYQDKPDVAVIQVTNIANLLSHRAFDSTASGKQEHELSNLQDLPMSSDGPVTNGSPYTGALTASTNTAGVNRQRLKNLNMSKGYSQYVKDIPLQYYPLQTGAKVQIRMGYTNNPDKLYPVFTGKITEIEGDEVLTLTAQGFLLELMDYNAEMKKDGYLNLNTSLTLKKGAAYGGWSFFKDSGTASSVISDVLKCSAAKHFGHWKVDPSQQRTDAQNNPIIFMQGFGWKDLAGAVAGSMGMNQIQRVLTSSYDRRDENILINWLINTDGSTSAGRLKRPDQFEKPWGLEAATYSVPADDPTITPWRVIKDISRRYPEHILSVRPYGFPYGCDATLVFAHPNDLYVTRHRLANSAESTAMNITHQSTFMDWWGTQAKSRVKSLAGLNLTSRVITRTILGWSSLIWADSDAETADRIVNMISNGGISAFQSILSQYAELSGSYEFAARFTQSLTLGYTDPKDQAVQVRTTAKILMDDCINFISRKAMRVNSTAIDPATPSYVQPVRKWHLITQANIIHNGITLNDQIYNAVKINDTVTPANANIPSYYLRTLDCDRLIINPVDNIKGSGDMAVAYAQSFLREEVGKMYRGELVLTGVPEIDPFDGILLFDPTTGMVGPLEVDSVIHTFDQEMGCISIVRPRAMVMVNEASTAGVVAALMDMDLYQELGLIASNPKEMLAMGAGSALAGGTAGALSSLAVGLGASSLLLPGLAVGLLFTMVILAANFKQGMYPLFLVPLNRYQRPWVAGLNGWALTDMHAYVEKKFQRLWNFEVAPTLHGFKRLNSIVNDYVPAG